MSRGKCLLNRLQIWSLSSVSSIAHFVISFESGEGQVSQLASRDIAARSSETASHSIKRENPSAVTAIFLGKSDRLSDRFDRLGDSAANTTLFVNLLSIYIAQFSISKRFNRSAYLSLFLILKLHRVAPNLLLLNEHNFYQALNCAIELSL